MGQLIEAGHWSLMSAYCPKAKYYALGDYVEYVRADKPYLMRRIDRFLTVALDVQTRRPGGFRIDGFRNFFLNHLKPRHRLLDDHFVALVSIIEIAATQVGAEVFPDEDVKIAYREVYKMAHDDQVVLRKLPVAA